MMTRIKDVYESKADVVSQIIIIRTLHEPSKVKLNMKHEINMKTASLFTGTSSDFESAAAVEISFSFQPQQIHYLSALSRPD